VPEKPEDYLELVAGLRALKVGKQQAERWAVQESDLIRGWLPTLLKCKGLVAAQPELVRPSIGSDGAFLNTVVEKGYAPPDVDWDGSWGGVDEGLETLLLAFADLQRTPWSVPGYPQHDWPGPQEPMRLPEPRDLVIVSSMRAYLEGHQHGYEALEKIVQTYWFKGDHEEVRRDGLATAIARRWGTIRPCIPRILEATILAEWARAAEGDWRSTDAKKLKEEAGVD
jgi:hypothetical protein